MPRDIVLGNGQLLVNLDHHLSIRDIYYPYVGWANHVGGYRCRVGVWADGSFAWLGDEWEWGIRYEKDTLVSDCTALHHGLGLRLHVTHAVLHDRNALLTQYTFEDLRGKPREIRLMLSHDLRIDESDIGDTAYYDPYSLSLIHYKRDRYFLFGGRSGAPTLSSPAIWQYACGEKAFRGAEGTWRDAEDGWLSMNAIEQGSVDSTISYVLHLGPNERSRICTWMIAGDSLDSVTEQQSGVIEEGFDTLVDTTRLHWRNYVSHGPDLSALPERVAALFNRSLLIIRTQADRGGAIIASNDSDIMETARAHYSYMWPRDGALVSSALDDAGLSDVTRAFFAFCATVLPKNRAALMHKYGPDGTIGASWHPWLVDGEPEIPFQEDGTALLVWGLWRHCRGRCDDEYARRMYERLGKPAASFIASFRYPENGLPKPSWDLWEERRGTHVFTCATVYAALDSASEYAAHLGDTVNAALFRKSADEVKQAVLTHLWDPDHGRFARMAAVGKDGAIHRDMTIDSSAYALFAFGMLPADDAKVVSTMDAIRNQLWVRTGMGGIARYERDYYFRVSDDFAKVPGNPWIICTLWLADWYIAVAKTRDELRKGLELLEWTALCASPTGILSEQVHPYTLQPLSVAPLTWSHAQFAQTATVYMKRLREFDGAG